MTEPLFRDDAYLKVCDATIVAINDRGGIILDRTIFYPNGGGQPGDTGRLLYDGEPIEIATTVYETDKATIAHVPAPGQRRLEPGQRVTCELDWTIRYRNMRTHTAMHLLCALVPFSVTGGQIAPAKGRLDFDVTEGTLDKVALSEGLQRLVADDRAISTRWITDEELLANPQLVRTMSVKPPMGSGRVRLVEIANCDLQPCGGTHVARTGEIGELAVSKIESKGAQNRRVRIDLAP